MAASTTTSELVTAPLESEQDYQLEKPCVLWHKSCFPKGYGQQRAVRFGRRLHYAHIVAWVDANGRLPAEGMRICHRCHVKKCVEPTHLYEGTQQENIHDIYRAGRGFDQKLGEVFRCGCPKVEANSKWQFDKRRDQWARTCLFHCRRKSREIGRTKRGVTQVKTYHHNGEVIDDGSEHYHE